MKVIALLRPTFAVPGGWHTETFQNESKTLPLPHPGEEWQTFRDRIFTEGWMPLAPPSLSEIALAVRPIRAIGFLFFDRLGEKHIGSFAYKDLSYEEAM